MPPEIKTSDVIDRLIIIIENALEDVESPRARRRLHLVSIILGAIGNEITPLFSSKYPNDQLLAAMLRAENGLELMEGGIRDFVKALHTEASSTTAKS